jgi:hypothetical protein
MESGIESGCADQVRRHGVSVAAFPRAREDSEPSLKNVECREVAPPKWTDASGECARRHQRAELFGSR